MLEAAAQAASEAELRRLEQADAGLEDCCARSRPCHMTQDCGAAARCSHHHMAANATHVLVLQCSLLPQHSGLNSQRQSCHLLCRVHPRVAEEWASSEAVSAATGPRHAVHSRWGTARMAPLLQTVVDTKPAALLSSLPRTGAMLSRSQLRHLIL